MDNNNTLGIRKYFEAYKPEDHPELLLSTSDMVEKGKKWYILEHHAEGLFAELAQFTEEEAKLFERILNYTDDTVEFYDEGHSGFMTIRTDLGGFYTKKEAIKKWLSGVTNWDYDALIGYDKYVTSGEWLDKFDKEEEE